MTARARAFGEILIVDCWGPGSEIERRPLRPGLPTIDIIFIEKGEFEFLEGEAWLRSRGPLMIAPSGLPLRVRFLGDWHFLVARVPRETILEYVPMLGDTVSIFTEMTIPERGMRAFLAQLSTDEFEVSEEESSTVDRQVLEMAGTLVRARHGQALRHDTPSPGTEAGL